jgi:hypothetical protein
MNKNMKESINLLTFKDVPIGRSFRTNNGEILVKMNNLGNEKLKNNFNYDNCKDSKGSWCHIMNVDLEEVELLEDS